MENVFENEFEEKSDLCNEWWNLAPETELQRLERMEELKAQHDNGDYMQDNVPD